MQQGDVILYQSLDGGDIESVNGLITMSGGLQTAAYLSLFGGNQYNKDENENIETETFKEWWGNSGEDEENKYISKTQNFLEGMPPISSNLKKVEELAKEDLKWMINTNLATEITVNASIPQINMVKLEINIDNQTFVFIENWRNQ